MHLQVINCMLTYQRWMIIYKLILYLCFENCQEGLFLITQFPHMEV